MRKTFQLFLTSCLLASASLSFAADERTTMGVESRQGIFEVIRMYFGPIYGMVKGQVPFDGAVVEHNAHKISELASTIPDGFVMNTQGSDVESEALDAIWDNIEDFKGKAATLAEKASVLSAAGADGLEATQDAFRGLGGACKACHDDYREQE